MTKKEGLEEVYTIEQPNECRLKLNVPLKLVNDINGELKRDHEISGVIYCNNKNHVIGFNKTKGDADSVYTPNNVINFHTHPISAYNNGQTVWGWPSGEDVRESIKFALAGNKAHLVFSVEGLYTIQISPCKIKKMKELLDDEERGILIFIIEEYFKSTHNFRGVDEVNRLAKKETFINPYSYIDFVNHFDLLNLLNKKKITHNSTVIGETKDIGHTGIHGENNINHYSFGNTQFSKIPNTGFPEVVNMGLIETKPIKSYIKQRDLKEICKITKSGDEEPFKIRDLDLLIKRLEIILEKFGTKQCNITWNHKNNSWFFVNFFPSFNYREKEYLKNNTFITPNKNVAVTTNIEPFIKIFSNKKEGCNISQIAQNNKFKIGKMTQIGSCKNCGFGKVHKNYKLVSDKKGLRLQQLLKDLVKVN